MFHSSRLARGDGRKGQRGLMLIWATLRYENVTVRSVTDDVFVREGLLVGVADSQNHKFSQDLSGHVRRGIKSAMDRGDYLGGPYCDGYRAERWHDERGRPQRRLVEDEVRGPVVRRVFELAETGIPDVQVARALNAEGHRTRNGRPYIARAVKLTVTHPFYSGRIVYRRGTPDERTVEGSHPALIARDRWERLQATRATSIPKGKSGRSGRPAQNHALARLAVCGKCGEPLSAVTSSYRRTDGTRYRSYICHAQRYGTGMCSANFEAEVVDAAVISALDTLLVDFNAWRDALEGRNAAERTRLSAEVERAEGDQRAQAVKAERVEAKWASYVADGDDRRADLVMPMVETARRDLQEAERRLNATRDALGSVPDTPPTDAMLDFGNRLRDAIRGRVDPDGTLKEINLALRGIFHAFVITQVEWAEGILVQPWLKPGVVQPSEDGDIWPMLLRHDDGPPPMRWLPAAPTGDLRGSGTAP